MDDIQNRWQQHQQHQQEQEQEHSRRPNRSSLARLQTQEIESNSNRFSFTTTPAVAQRSTFDEPMQRPYTMIDEEPMTPETANVSAPQQSLPAAVLSNAPSPQATMHTASSASPQPETRRSPVTAGSPYYQQIPPPTQQMHPAHFAPYASPPTPPQPAIDHAAANQHHHQQYYHHASQGSATDVSVSNTSEAPRTLPPMTYPPMPQSPNFQTSTDTKKEPSHPAAAAAASPGQFSLEHPDQNIYSHPAVPHSPLTPAFSPASPFGGPNTSAFHLGHRPGQVAHPLSSAPKTWHAGTLSPSGTCAASIFCPCVTYGRVQYRLAQRGRRAEATDLLGHASLNADCGLFAALAACGLCGPLAAVQRTRTRRAYGIEDGGVVGDCLRGCCCCCCAVALNEREITHREEERRRLAGPPATGGYTSMGRMTYPG